jgi:type IV pilus assembly protein PilZ
MTDKDEKDTDKGIDRREWHRVLVDLEVDYGNADNFLFAYIRDISETGIFIRTNEPQKIGTLLNLRFMPDDGNRQFLQLEGEVLWVNSLRSGDPDNIHPGMGVRFVGLTPEDRFRLIEYIKTFAYLDDPHENPDSKTDPAKNDEKSN